MLHKNPLKICSQTLTKRKKIEVIEIYQEILIRYSKMLISWKKKVMTNLESVLKRRDIALLTKAHIVKAMIFPEVMYRYEIWTIKKAECQPMN